MTFCSSLIVEDRSILNTLETFERDVGGLLLGEKISLIQSLNEKTGVEDIAKIFLLFITSEKEIRLEIRRILSWHQDTQKVQFIVQQFKSLDRTIFLSSIELAGAMRTPLSIPYLANIFDITDVERCVLIIDALDEINSEAGIGIVNKALLSTNDELLIRAIKSLSKWPDEVGWKVFVPYLSHKNPEIRNESAFSISLHRDKKSAGTLLTTINQEKDRNTRNDIIRYIGLVPNKKILIPLLTVSASDPDQKARLVASRALDRVQGIIGPKPFFRLRKHSNINIRSEVIFRLGKFGAEHQQHKKYLRKILKAKKSSDFLLVQSSIQALGYISDRTDISTLVPLIYEDTITSYNATMALIRIWRMEDKDQVIEILNEDISPVLKQIILKYIIRRRGLSISPEVILDCVEHILSTENDVNTRYLALSLLEFAPSLTTIDYLTALYTKASAQFEMEAITRVLTGLFAHYGETIFEHLKNYPLEKSQSIIKFLPIRTKAVKKILTLSIDERLKISFLQLLVHSSRTDIIQNCMDEIIRLLYTKNKGLLDIATKLINMANTPDIIPHLIKSAEGENSVVIKGLARQMVARLLYE